MYPQKNTSVKYSKALVNLKNSKSIVVKYPNKFPSSV